MRCNIHAQPNPLPPQNEQYGVRIGLALRNQWLQVLAAAKLAGHEPHATFIYIRDMQQRPTMLFALVVCAIATVAIADGTGGAVTSTPPRVSRAAT